MSEIILNGYKMDSSSFSSHWSGSQGSHTKGDLLQIQEMKLQNEHLQARIQQLQNSLESSNSQLKQAIEAAAAVSPLHEEITNLKLQLRDANEKLIKTKNSYTLQVADLNQKLEEEKAKSSKTNLEQAKEITKYKNLSKESQKERDLVTDELILYKQQLSDATDKLQKTTKQKTKSRALAESLGTKLNEYKTKYEDCKLENDQLRVSKTALEQEVLHLRDEVETLKQASKHTTDTLHFAQNENSNLRSAITALQEQFELQKDDFSAIADERDNLLQIIKKLHSAVCYYEDEMESLKQQNSILQDKTKRAVTKPQLFNDQFNIDQLSFPFNDEVKKQVNTILGYDHFQPMQKMQLIINEISKTLNRLQKDVDTTTKASEAAESENKDIKEKFQQTYDLLNTITREWKNLECNEIKIDAVEFCENDERFLDFVAEECVKIDNLPEAAEFLGPLFVPANLLGDESANDRHELISAVAKTNKDLSTLISIIFLANQRLKKQFNKLLASTGRKEELNECLTNLGVENVNKVPEIVESLQAQIAHLKSTRRELHMALVEARNALREHEKSDENMNEEIEKQKQRVSELAAENERLRADIERLTNNTSMTLPIHPPTAVIQPSQPPVTSSMNSSQESVKSASSDIELKITLANMRKSLEEKNMEAEELKRKLSEIAADAEHTKTEYKRREIRREQNIEELEHALTVLSDKLQKTKKKARQVIAQLQSEHQTEVDSIVKNFDAAKLELNSALQEAKDNCEKAKDAAKTLQESLTSETDKSKELKDENARLQRGIQNLESKVAMVQDQLSKEQKSAQANLTVKLLNAENVHQKEVKELKQKYEQEKQRSFEFFTSHLGALYGIIDFDYDEASITQLFAKIQADLNKLKYFQDQATRL